MRANRSKWATQEGILLDYESNLRGDGEPWARKVVSRSEERRVGKECRYWRDWSSDVSSSDLHVRKPIQMGHSRRNIARLRIEPARRRGTVGEESSVKIGRASCRERV